MHTSIINTMSLRHVSPLKVPSSGSVIDTFQNQGQQKELPDVKFTLVSSM